MKRDKQDERIEAILGNFEDMEFDETIHIFYQHLKTNLLLPCEVTGIEDFKWEEFYVFGPGNEEEYDNLKKTRPSYTDRYELLGVDRDVQSEWMIFVGDDLGARVRRISDGKKFMLGLSELKAVDKRTNNYQLLDDFSVWLVNSR